MRFLRWLLWWLVGRRRAEPEPLKLEGTPRRVGRWVCPTCGSPNVRMACDSCGRPRNMVFNCRRGPSRGKTQPPRGGRNHQKRKAAREARHILPRDFILPQGDLSLMEGIRRGVADVKAGRVTPWEEVKRDLERSR